MDVATVATTIVVKRHKGERIRGSPVVWKVPQYDCKTVKWCFVQ